MNKFQKLEKARQNMQQVLHEIGALADGDYRLQNCKGHCVRAIQVIDESLRREAKKTQQRQSQFQETWGSSLAKTPTPQVPLAPMSKPAAMRTLKQLDELFGRHKAAIDAFESVEKKPVKDEALPLPTARKDEDEENDVMWD